MYKIAHIVPETRYGGIFRYIELETSSNPSAKSYLFSNQPRLPGLNYFPYNVICLRIIYSPLILVDLLLNTVSYVLLAMNVNEIHLHSSFCVFHHLLFRFFGINSYLYIHDYNIPRIFYFFLFLSKRLYVVSPALQKDFPRLFKHSKVKPPHYELDNVQSLTSYSYRPLTDPRTIIFRNINKVKQISQYASQLFSHSLTGDHKFKLDIYGTQISTDTVRIIKSLHCDDIKLIDPVIPSLIDKVLINYNFLVIPSHSEVFPLVYYESLRNGVIPLVNNISFFSLCTSLRSHIFDINDPVSFKLTHEWALSLSKSSYITYHQQLLSDFSDFYGALVEV